MMQEYEDDFFFEEDRINSSSKVDNGKLQEKVITENSHETENFAETENLQETECIFNDLRVERYDIHYQDLLGMTVTSGSVTLNKDEKNLIGVSIGGGAPLCPCLYIVQIFDNTPAYRCGILQSGDELVGVNGQSVKGKTKVEVAKMIQSAKDEVVINYNKLHADPKQGKSLDIIMKKMKHRLVENMSAGTADALGLSRAILCNDTLVAKLKELRETEAMYKRLVQNAKRYKNLEVTCDPDLPDGKEVKDSRAGMMLKSYFDLLQTYQSIGDIFAGIGVREPQARASEAFTKFGQYHRLLERDGIKMLKGLKPILEDMGTYLNKAIPDTKLTIRKYADTKFEYLSYCLKVKEMDDEEYALNAVQEPSYRVETGNYEYRLILRCRQDARLRFARLRSDVLIKIELLENKKIQDVAFQLKRFINALAVYLNETVEHLKDHISLFPIEVDLSQNAFQYKSTTQVIQDSQEDEIEYGREIEEHYDINDGRSVSNRCQDFDKNDDEDQQQLLPGLTDNAENKVDNLTLLSELGLDDPNLTVDSSLTDLTEFGDFQNGLMDEFVPQNNAENNDIFDKLLSELNNEK